MPIKATSTRATVAAKPPVSAKPTAVTAKPTVAAKPAANGHANGADVPTAATSANTPGGHFEAKETTLQIARRYPGGEDTSEVIEVRTFATRVASVSVSAKQRLGSIGQGGEVSVMLTVPTYLEELDGAQQFATDKVGEYMAIEQERLVELAGPGAESGPLPGEAGYVEPDEGETEASGEGEAEGETGEEPIDADYIRALEPDDFVQFCTDNEVEIDLEGDFNGDVDAAKEGVIAVMIENGMIAAEEAAADGEGEAGEGEAAEGEVAADDLYTEEALKELKVADLNQIIVEWEIEPKAPGQAKGVSPADHKKRLIKKILDFQENLQTT